MNAVPAPGEDAPLADWLAARIRAHGPIGVDAWMAACLGDPRHGYYAGARGNAVPIGAAGDFVTAPEVSQVFGELLGAWAAATWGLAGSPSSLRLVELGPGRGTLMADALRATARPAPGFHRAIDIHLVEVNPALRAAQARAIGRAATWHDSIDTLPAGPAIFIANEFLDALPARQLVFRDGAWRERMVGLDEAGRFAFRHGPAIGAPALEPGQEDPREGDVVEVPEAARGMVAAIADRIARQGGAALFIDYGPMASGIGDTLQGLRRHESADPLSWPGETDLTVHVDLPAMARAARRAGAQAWGPVPQGAFLSRLGLHARAAALARGATPAQREALRVACARLIGDAEMGSLFKAMAIGAPGLPVPAGFDATPPSG
ncbi:MAG: class I SAM-dependent methyltransferase [Alphaproteobacteria bacterium]|nr:class I SAM-dependent methyltransferase [Alphaproteobacteria bacterium]